MSSRRSRADGDLLERAAEVEAARRAVHVSFSQLRNRRDPDDPATLEWQAEIKRFRAAIDLAYPGGFWDDLVRASQGDWAGLETLIGFLEADPFFFRSGYAKERILKLVKRAPLDAGQRARLRDVCLAVVDGRDRREFRNYCRLAAALDDPALRAGLSERLESADSGVRRRAGWMRDALGRAARRPPERAPNSAIEETLTHTSAERA